MTQSAYLAPSPLFQFVGANGAPLSGGLVFTYANNTATKATTYVDAVSGTPNTNPIVLDTYGTASIWLPPGQLFTFVISPSTDTDPPSNSIKTINNIAAGDAVATVNYSQDTGLANAITVAPPGLSTLFAGLTLTARIAQNNTGPTTLNAGGTGALPVVLQNGAPLSGQELQSNGQYLFQYTGTAWMLLGLSIPPGHELTAAEIAATVTPVNYAFAPGNVNRYGTNTVPNTTDMTAAFQAAINQAGQPNGARVFVPAGTYNIAGQLTLSSNIVMYGEGVSSIVNFSSTVNQHSMVGTGVSYCTVQQLSLNVTGVQVLGSLQSGVIAFYNSNYCNVYDCLITGTAYSGIVLFDSSFCRVERNWLENFTLLLNGSNNLDNSDIHIGCDSVAGSVSNIIAHNYCYGGTTNNGAAHGISCEVSNPAALLMQRNLIDGNHVGAHSAYGILLYSHAAGDTYNRVVNNHVEGITGQSPNQGGAAGAGIYVAGMSAVTILGNTIVNCCQQTSDFSLAAGGIGYNGPATGSPSVIMGNAIYDMAQGNANAGTAGIYIAGFPPGSTITGNLISQQVSAKLGSGIYLSTNLLSSVVYAPENVTLSANVINLLPTLTTTRGIYIYSNGASAQSITITGNTVTGASYRGITLETNGGYPTEIFTIAGNTVSGGGASSIPLNVLLGAYGTITGNSLNANTVAAVNVSAATYTRMSGNMCLTTGTAAFVTASVNTGSLADESNLFSSSAGVGTVAVNNAGTGFNVRSTGGTYAVKPAAGTAALGDYAAVLDGSATGFFAWVCSTAPTTWTGITIP